VLRRFNALATAEEITEISYHLRGMIQLLSACFHACEDTRARSTPPYTAVFGLPVSSRLMQLGGTVCKMWKSTYRRLFMINSPFLALENAGIKSDDKGTKALFFMSTAQAKALAELAVEGSADKKQYRDALKAAPSMDMALFGRMVADDPSLNYDAAAQVAHSISLMLWQNEYDYFTAVDDCQAEDNAGAGHLGTVEYNSSTLYRYATVNVMELAGQLGAAQAAETVRAFGEAFLFSMPTGKQNTFANRTLPDAVYVTLREDQPVNLCGAFERAVPRSAQGYAAPSKAALAQYAQQMCHALPRPRRKALPWAAGWRNWLRRRRQRLCWTHWKRLSGMHLPEMRWGNGNAVASAGSAFTGVGRGLQI